MSPFVPSLDESPGSEHYRRRVARCHHAAGECADGRLSSRLGRRQALARPPCGSTPRPRPRAVSRRRWSSCCGSRPCGRWDCPTGPFQTAARNRPSAKLWSAKQFNDRCHRNKHDHISRRRSLARIFPSARRASKSDPGSGPPPSQVIVRQAKIENCYRASAY